MTDDAQKNPVGHPSLYREEYCQQVVDLGRQGMSFVEIADELDVSPKTLRNWRGKFPEFEEAMQKAKRADQAWWERLMRGIATGEVKGNVQAVTKSLQCRFKQDWTERSEVTGSDGAPLMRPTTIQLIGVSPEPRDDEPANVIDLQANRTDEPAAPAILDDGCYGENEGFSNLGEPIEPAPLRSAAELLALFDAGHDLDFTEAEERLFSKALRKRAKQQEAEAIQAEQERIARQAQQRLMLPRNIGARKRAFK